MSNAESWEELQKLPEFLEAIGRGGEPIAFTAYGGEGGNWHLRKNREDKTALEVEPSSSVIQELAQHGERARKDVGHQLGFYPGRGGSKKDQLTTLPCLKAESDHCSIAEQLRVYEEFEHCYGVKLTLVSTGGKSIHAYLRLHDSIQKNKYLDICRVFNEKLVEIGESLEISFIPDKSVFNPAQAMRLPGAVHGRTGQVAKVMQYGTPCSLSDIEIDEEAISISRTKNKKQRVDEMLCQQGQILGYEGDEAHQILYSIAVAWPKRVPGENTYNKVFPLVGALSNLLGPEKAAELLHSAGHFDRSGEPSKQGLLQWCQSFSPRDEPPSAIKSRLIERAERQFSWKRPEAADRALILKISALTAREDAIGDQIRAGGGVLVHQTGYGKTVRTLKAIRDLMDQAQIQAFEKGRESKLSAGVLSPRAVLNNQNAEIILGVNLSNRKKNPNHAVLPNIYVFCPQSLGNPSALNGDPFLWGEYYSYGDIPGGKGKIKTGKGMAAAAFLVIDEFRQLMEMLLLSDAEQGGGLWRTPEQRMTIVRNVFITIENAVNVYALDAQMGVIDQQLLQSLRPGRADTQRVIGNPPRQHGGTFAFTNSKSDWRAELRAEITSPKREKPIICIVGSKGDPTDFAAKQLSAWSLKNLIESIPFEEYNRSFRAEVIDGVTKNGETAQKILKDGIINCDVVIATSVAQSGFSWVGAFHEVGFVVGAETLPPNVAGGQAGRRERTLKRCVAYLPLTTTSRKLPFSGDSPQEILSQIEGAHWKYLARLGKYEKIFVEAQANYTHRRLVELSAFTEIAISYAKADGWKIEQLVKSTESKQNNPMKRKRAKKSHVKDWEELNPAVQQLLLTLSGQMTIEKLSELQHQWVAGGAGTDLVKANLVEVSNLLKRAGLFELCDGEIRAREDESIMNCAMVLKQQESINTLNKCGPLELRIGRSMRHNDPAKTKPEATYIKLIGAVVRALGGQGKSSRGRQGVRIAWQLPIPNTPGTL